MWCEIVRKIDIANFVNDSCCCCRWKLNCFRWNGLFKKRIICVLHLCIIFWELGSVRIHCYDHRWFFITSINVIKYEEKSGKGFERPNKLSTFKLGTLKMLQCLAMSKYTHVKITCHYTQMFQHFQTMEPFQC